MSINGTLCCLGVLWLTTSHTQYYKKMDEFGGNFDKIIKSGVEKDSNFLLVRQSQMETPQILAVTAFDEPNLALSGQVQGYTQCDTDNQLTEHPTTVGLLPTAGRKILFDNFNFATKVHNMNQDHQNSDVHWVTHLAVNRVSGNYLPSGKPICDILCLQNGKCLPKRYEHHLQRENCITLTERFIVEIPCLSFLKSVVTKHIPHQYTTEMAKPSETVSEIGYYYYVLHNDIAHITIR